MIKLCRLAGKNHPSDWLEFYESHTPYEWQLQWAAAIVEQFGEGRADNRAKGQALYAKATDLESLEAALQLMSTYPDDEPQDPHEIPVDHEILAELKQT